MGFWRRKKLAGVPDDEPEFLSYGPLYDEDGPGDPEFGAWLDKKLGLKSEPEPETQTKPAERTRWWWFKRGLLARIPLGRVAETDDLVGAVLFFCSDASSFVTGQILTLDGGLTATQ